MLCILSFFLIFTKLSATVEINYVSCHVHPTHICSLTKVCNVPVCKRKENGGQRNKETINLLVQFSIGSMDSICSNPASIGPAVEQCRLRSFL
jgi:hypothetical protein